jgi:hypothetical protein
VQQRLSLAATALHIAAVAILFHLSNVSLDRLPAFGLSLIVVAAPAHVIAAIPLKPATRIDFV